MNLKELDEYRITDVIKFHNKLNPSLFEGEHLKSSVRKALLSIAEDFIQYIGLSDLQVDDIRISGSNAAYSYTPHSDIDLHIIVDFKKLPEDEVYSELFHSKKTLYNDAHTIKVKGYDVEVYVQDSNEKHHSLGEYSVKNNEWIKFPIRRRANLDQAATLLKLKKLIQLCELALQSSSTKKVDQVLKKLRKYRQAGLEKLGEFGPENLAYKILRDKGYIQKLYDLRDKLHSRELSLNSTNNNSLMIADEDYDPNGPPPGPEFKPTMPSGTVRVDISDVYDWYKLGQHISNLKGLGKHDFGKGPPSTILSFGDEDIEHQYIKDLEKTGLTTTDIDPVDPKQPKGMKRQKVDPTYNVNEEKTDHTAIVLTNLPKYFKNDDPLEKFVPERSNVTYALHPEKYESTFYSLTNKDIDKLKYYRPKKIDIPPGTLVGDMALANKFYRANNDLDKELYARLYKESLKPYPVDLSNYKMPELLIPKTITESASGYIPSNAERDDPRYKTGLTVDVKPDSIKRNAKKLGLGNIHRSGIPPIARSDGRIK